MCEDNKNIMNINSFTIVHIFYKNTIVCGCKISIQVNKSKLINHKTMKSTKC